MNRHLTGILADLHFAPTEQAAINLIKENKGSNFIYVTGNTVIDALKFTVKSNFKHQLLDLAGNKKPILMTVHRRENLGEPIKGIFRAIRRLADHHPDILIVFPVHPNPLIAESAHSILGNHKQILLVNPLDTFDFHNIMARSFLIFTDSGGIQEEAPYFGVPVLVLRDTTERPEGIEACTVKLADTNEETIFSLGNQLLSDETVYQNMAQAANPYGDGKASSRINHALLHYFGLSKTKPVPFSR